MKLIAADLFCGAGGTSTGMAQAAAACGRTLELTAVNHWPTAVETHRRAHPQHRHVCASVDSISPTEMFPDRRLDVLWASPECTHFSHARGGRPVLDQRRAGAWCVVRWAEALAPEEIFVENVREFLTWGPLTRAGRPQKRRRGATFRAWVAALESLGYRVEHRLLCAADYGDPTSRERLFIRASRRGRITWPTPTHGGSAAQPWRAAREVIDWGLPAQGIYSRAKPLATATMRRIEQGRKQFREGSFLVSYYGNGGPASIYKPLPTVTTKQRFGLVQTVIAGGAVDVRFRMLEPHELAAAQGFPKDYEFTGTKADKCRQIGNAVPCGLARALVGAALQ